MNGIILGVNKEAVIILLLCAVNLANIKSQDVSTNQMAHKPNEIYFNIGAAYMNKLSFDHLGEPILESQHTISPIGEFGYCRSVYKNFGLKLGIGFAPIPFNINYSFNFESDTPASGMRDFKTSEYYIKNFYFIILLNKKLVLDQKLLLEFEVGMQYNSNIENCLPLSLSTGVYSQEEEQGYDLFLMELYYNENVSKIISLRGGFNFQYYFSGKHSLRSGISFNYFPKDIAIGYYEFYNIQIPSYGNIYLGMNYIGLQFTYAFSF